MSYLGKRNIVRGTHRHAISQATVMHQGQSLLKHCSGSREIVDVAITKHVREVENTPVIDQHPCSFGIQRILHRCSNLCGELSAENDYMEMRNFDLLKRSFDPCSADAWYECTLLSRYHKCHINTPFLRDIHTTEHCIHDEYESPITVLSWAVSTTIRFVAVMRGDMWVLCKKRSYSASIPDAIFEWRSETKQTLVNNDYMQVCLPTYESRNV